MNETGLQDDGAEEDVIAGEIVNVTVSDGAVGLRLDKALALVCPDFSRSRLQTLIEGGQVLINDMPCASSSYKTQEGDRVRIHVPPPVSAQPLPENIPLDIIYEDNDLLVINKPAGMVVHPGAGNHTGTLVNALLSHCGDTLSGIGGVARPGIVHRLDKDTSGLMVVAKNDHAHKGLAAQLETRTLSRIYQAIIFKKPFPPKGTIDQPIGRHAQHRLKMSIDRRSGRESRTHYQVLQDFNGAISLVECKLESGRTHQIRVHMEYLEHPIIGDPLYGPQGTAVRSVMSKAGYQSRQIEDVLGFPRQALHARHIMFEHPAQLKTMDFTCDLPMDMAKLLENINK